MAWVPASSEPVGSNEHIGRRLFKRQTLRGAQDQTPPVGVFELFHFEEVRDEGDVSLDRLGKSSVDGKVRKYLDPRARAAISMFAQVRTFNGWAVVRAKELQEPQKGPPLPIIPSPIVATDGNPLSENKYHAHVKRPGSYGVYEMAIHLKVIFERKYKFEAAGSPGSGNREPTTSVVAVIISWLRRAMRLEFVRSQKAPNSANTAQ
jgi:hypothetical protein